MASRGELLVYGCRDEDIAMLKEVCGPGGPSVRIESSPVEVAHSTVARRPIAVFIGAGACSLENLDLIPVIQAVRGTLPVVVIAEDDSLDLERRARQRSIFYYLVQPLEREEVEAILGDVMRRAGS